MLLPAFALAAAATDLTAVLADAELAQDCDP
jgi:hypothetical protein